MSVLADILNSFRTTSHTEREKGNYFENLVKVYLLNEPLYKDLFNGQVWLWEEWRRYQKWPRKFEQFFKWKLWA
jgi:predicted helicase